MATWRPPSPVPMSSQIDRRGFGSNVSTCDMPPFRNSKMTCFALPGKCDACRVPRLNGASADDGQLQLLRERHQALRGKIEGAISQIDRMLESRGGQ